MWENSETLDFIKPKKEIHCLGIEVGDFIQGSEISVISGVLNSNQFFYPNTHTWTPANPERWYPFR